MATFSSAGIICPCLTKQFLSDEAASAWAYPDCVFSKMLFNRPIFSGFSVKFLSALSALVLVWTSWLLPYSCSHSFSNCDCYSELAVYAQFSGN